MRTRASARALEAGAVALVAAGLLVAWWWRASEATPRAAAAATAPPPELTASTEARSPRSSGREPTAIGAPRASQAPAIATGAPLDEPSLMTRLRALEDGDPAAAAALAREGNRRFPDSADAPERSSILVHALAAQGLAMEARGEAEDMVNRSPDSSWVREVELFTGAHRHRNLRLTDAGVLESY